MNILSFIFSFLLILQQQTDPIENLQQKLDSTTKEGEKISVLIELGVQTFYSDQNKALIYINQAIELAKENGDRQNHILALTKSSKFHAVLGKHVEARTLGLQAMEIARVTKTPESLLLSAEALGMGAIMIGDHETALTYYNKALELLNRHKIDDPQLQLLVYGNVIRVFEELKQYDRAIEYALKAYEAIKDNPAKVIPSLHNIGLLYIRTHNLEKARLYADKLLKISKEQNHKWGESGAHSLYGDINIIDWEKTKEEKYLKLTEANYRLSLKALKGASKDLHYADRLVALADTLNRQGKYRESEQLLLESLDLAVKLQGKLNLTKSHQLLVVAYKGLNNNAKAWHHNQEYLRIKEEIGKENLNHQLSSMMVRFDVSKKEGELRETRLINKSLRKDAEINNYLLISVSLAAALALIIIGIIALLYTQKKKMAKRFEDLSKTDPLTQLLNRRAMLESMKNEQNRFQRNKNIFSLVITDIDHFKTFNDTYGHDCGDVVLKTVSNLFQNNLRKMDQIARWGGEEFLLMLPETDQASSALVAEKLRQRIEEMPIPWKGDNLRVTMSFGVCEFSEELELDQCISKADESLYRAKEAGRNKVGIAID